MIEFALTTRSLYFRLQLPPETVVGMTLTGAIPFRALRLTRAMSSRPIRTCATRKLSECGTPVLLLQSGAARWCARARPG